MTRQGITSRLRGFTLMETVVSVGVLAVAAPLVVAAMVRAGESSALARAESRSPVMISACLGEIAAARHGRSRLLDDIPDSGAFPADGIAVVAFGAGGRLLGRIGEDDYENGLLRLDNQSARYLVRIDAEPEQVRADGRPTRSVRMSVEYPAAATAENRRRLDFYSRVP